VKGPEPGSKGSDQRKIVANNKKARHDYTIEDVFECGLVLKGTEVKSLRQGRASLTDAYGDVRDGEVWLLGAHIPEYTEGTWTNHEPRRPRKILLHKAEILRLIGKTRESGLALVPLQLYFTGGRAKVELALGRGRKAHDKRQVMAERDAQREIRNAMGRRAKGRT
jgi:SsrA-binding protein